MIDHPIASSPMNPLPPITDIPNLRKQAIATHRLGHLSEAAALYRRLLTLEPRHAEALHMLGLIELQADQLEPALSLLQQSLNINGARASAHSDLGVLLHRLHRHDEALASFACALALEPGNAGTHGNHGNVLQAMHRYDQALASHQRAVQLQPRRAEGHYNLGSCWQQIERHAPAIACFDQALQLQPEYPEALNNRAMSLRALDRQAEALANCDVALQLRPDFPDALYNRASVLRDLQRIEEALDGFRHLQAISPSHDYIAGIIMQLQLQCCDWTNYLAQVDNLVEAVARGERADLPFSFLAISDSPATQRQCARTQVAHRYPSAAQPLCSRPPRTNARIRLAYLSADFHEHATAYLMAGLFEAHDRQRFEIMGISFGAGSQGPMRQRLQRSFDQFIDVRRMNDAEIAALLHDAEVDIVVDTKGFTTSSRPGIFARRPAPVQVNYLGFPGSMGADYIDYVIADRHVIPPEHQQHYFEKVVHLPDSYQANDDKRQMADHIPSRSELGLPERGFVFCCFNNNYKISPDIFGIWMRLLESVEHSVLWLMENSAIAAHNLRREAAVRGIAPERLVFAKPLPQAEHLARQQRADLFLDTLPYNAHTTASDALWAGLPVLTCTGHTFAGRVATSLLHAIGLPELVTHSLADYEHLALQLAADPARLAALKKRLADHRLSEPLFNTGRFCRHIEAAYQEMWDRHQRGLPPEGFSVASE